MLILADAVVLAPDRVLRPGQLRLSGRTIRELGQNLRPEPGEEILDLSGLTLAPGFINLHAHLELAPLHEKIRPGQPFADWLRQLLPLLPGLHSTARTAAIAASSRQAAETGTTAILNIVSDLSALAGLAGTVPRIWWALEFMDLHGDAQPAARLERLAAWLSRHPGCDWQAAVSPHAPFTASAGLFQESARLARELRLPFTTHWAESAEEKELFASGRSPLRSLLPEAWNAGSLSDRAGKIPAASLLAHGNSLSDEDFSKFGKSGCFCIHCPTTHRWFSRETFPLEKFRKHKIQVVLGTDSPASSDNPSFDLRAEARAFHRTHPGVSWAEIWSMLTTLPAEALGQAGRLGTLTPGAEADWIAWRLPPTPTPSPHPSDPIDPVIPAILNSTDSAEFVCVAARLHRPEKI